MVRADARRNRERITTTALDLFAEHGSGVSMEDIARAAGLGVGTLYRHFPDRLALVTDIANAALQGLRDHALAQSAEDISRWEVLLRVVRHCAGQPFALITSLAGTPPVPPSTQELIREVNVLLAEIAKQAQEEGTMRGDITPDQVVGLLNVMVCRPGARPDDPLTTVMLDGLRAGRTA
ncbi:TetR/AcrR family transcriptional regulator [Nonomuraea angiospora]|uniref:AcrR family transcriptional regulator n=1 Tax=Nonomuraea angiospora TaxID=46172 RepID=A0ABR9M257_9ACTN|nr:TetR/AcrR family transcriptional regulator [Nonomuraea angiospora]MBE1586958.1 AcrR family transcriptional regulator [Nonomuraea angiospora]MDX3100885.1 TetR/AcrR family transcriptional regulator [Nonomuraea angiospora]